jgi:23S rRNA (adenine2503-C2)-methyltransferase
MTRLTPKFDLHSRDGWTHKVLFSLPGNTELETVLMRYPERNTVCVSSQAGCAMNCSFCATGQAGFQRNLTAGEIVEQILFFARRLTREGQRLTNLVFMGMGEPLANYPAIREAIARLTDPEGFNFGDRRITISTVGLVPGIEKFTAERSQVNLAVSLHAATDELRSQLMPINKRYPLDILLEACRAYTETTHRRLSFEWAMISGVNDTPEQAHALAERIRGMLCHVNFIPLNPTPGYEGRASSEERIRAFRTVLDRYGIPNSVRERRGIDINAGCGQLRQQSLTDQRKKSKVQLSTVGN